MILHADYTGNVGIGTTEPGYKLQVNGNAKFDSDVYFYNTVLDPASNFATQRGAGFKASTGKFEIASSETALELSRFSTTGPVLSIRHSGSQVSSLDTDGGATFTGDVSIGGDLTVDGIITAKEFHTTFVSASIIYESGSTKFGDSSDDIHYFTGNIGVNVSDPQAPLEVKGASNTPADGNEVISITNTTGGTKLLLGVAENSYGWIQAAEGSTIRNLLLNPLGANVGIGNTSPGAELHIGDGSTSERILIQSSGGGGTLRFYDSANDVSGDRYQFIGHLDTTQRLQFSATGSGAVAMSITPPGSIGIGVTTPSTILHVYRGGTGTAYDLTLQSGDDTTGARHGILFRGGAANYEALIRTGNYGAYRSNLEFWVSNQTSGGSTLVQALSILSAGDVRLNEYGSGTFTGRVSSFDNLTCRIY